ncbi:hypothetical protein [Streptomyces fragilis]|uniref:Anti-sigma factor n=1 Tax=Streptomyces fragilis TaxID=67301 RepID=A0ABV2YH55_9ACTN|nr:hypothetical protein [Streptomyces fragilis]
MAHVDPTRLMELAQGHRAPPGDPVVCHLARCAPCREELRRTALVVAAARGVREPDLPAAPPERVWRRIAEGLGDPEAPPAPRAGPPHGPAAVLRQRLRGILRRVRGLRGLGG